MKPMVLDANMLGRLYNFESETMIIASVLMKPEVLVEVRAGLDPSDFGKEALRTIYETMISMAGRDIHIDVETLHNELKKSNLLGRVGGLDYLAYLVGSISTTAGLSYHIEEVRACRARRALAGIADKVMNSLRANEDVLQIMSDVRLAMRDISGGEKAIVVPMKKAVKEALQAIEALAEAPGHVIGVPSGFEKIDRITGGWQSGELIIIAGRPSMGKSVLAKDFAENSHVPVAYFTLEMSTVELVKRQVASHSGVNFEAIRTGRLSAKDWGPIVSAAAALDETPVFYIDSASLSINELERIAHSLRISDGIGLVVIDYLQLLKGSVRNEGREREVADMSRRLKVLARDLGVPVICLAQLNRKCEERGKNKRPILSDLRESGSLEQDADIVAFVYRDAVYNVNAPKHMAELIIAKGRNIRTGTVKLFFDGGHQVFRNLKEEEEPGR